ncbi:MAG: protein phosphatase 2C domain-containing protein [Thermaerobacter sp.]|nr:protein phosphatase 2C domain-containing protein [Thermaerobacter sp.]
MAVKAYGRTHRGLVRHENQDHFLVLPLKPAGWLVAVADGMGGYPGGGGASSRALEIVADRLSGRPHSVVELEQTVKACNQDLFEWAQRERRLMGMGTTLTLAQIVPGQLQLAHVGDSRAYRLRAGIVDRLTQDHSVAAELQQAGQISVAEAAQHPQRHVLTRVVGPWLQVRVDLLAVPWHAADRLLVCSDGLSGLLSDEELGAVWQLGHGETLLDHLVTSALERGGNDNVTAVLVEEDEPGRGWEWTDRQPAAPPERAPA